MIQRSRERTSARSHDRPNRTHSSGDVCQTHVDQDQERDSHGRLDYTHNHEVVTRHLRRSNKNQECLDRTHVRDAATQHPKRVKGHRTHGVEEQQLRKYHTLVKS